MITRTRIDEMHSTLSSMRDADMLCVFCHSGQGQYHHYDCVLANAADTLVEMFDMLDAVESATLPFRLGRPAE
jgi:hypothetical protein